MYDKAINKVSCDINFNYYISVSDDWCSFSFFNRVNKTSITCRTELPRYAQDWNGVN